MPDKKHCNKHICCRWVLKKFNLKYRLTKCLVCICTDVSWGLCWLKITYVCLFYPQNANYMRTILLYGINHHVHVYLHCQRQGIKHKWLYSALLCTTVCRETYLEICWFGGEIFKNFSAPKFATLLSPFGFGDDLSSGRVNLRWTSIHFLFFISLIPLQQGIPQCLTCR